VTICYHDGVDHVMGGSLANLGQKSRKRCFLVLLIAATGVLMFSLLEIFKHISLFYLLGIVPAIVNVFSTRCYSVLRYSRLRGRKKIAAALMASGVSDPECMTPEQYEQFCVAILASSGWKVSLAKKDDDAVSDVIAEKNGRRLVIQCRQWSSMVGHRAIRKAHEAFVCCHSDQAIIVATDGDGYEKLAKELAEVANVRLLTHEDLVAI
jgi:HJR/Mrr/RecB family endonuclease